ncbi:hypothetical protein [Arthrobacter sp. efr-133-TYG-104]|uniref:hypothetical protein n=1 Tax=Arthrobacter sp. efr-133-TYG-104 TaxID=3040324 RepID=UPI0025506CC1|nr:hypothetical protein [Arthrobacter sp. efr-133-TYG-104]
MDHKTTLHNYWRLRRAELLGKVENLSEYGPDSDMWVPANESRQEIIEFHHYSARHARHADIIRELIDGTAGMKANDPNMPARNSEEWAAYRYRIEEAARTADLQRY